VEQTLMQWASSGIHFMLYQLPRSEAGTDLLRYL